jgi:hypothetical protein
LLRGILKNRLESFQIGMNVTEKSDPHGNTGECLKEVWRIGPDCREQTYGDYG